jgi:Uma2 family endonuclease
MTDIAPVTRSRRGQRIISPTFPELTLDVDRILKIGPAR